MYVHEVRQFNSRNGCSMSRGCGIRQTYVPKHVWKCSNLRLRELQTKWAVCSQATEEAVRVRCVLLVERRVTRIWSSGQTLSFLRRLIEMLVKCCPMNIGLWWIHYEHIECLEWHRRFKEGQENVQDNLRIRQPKRQRTDPYVDSVQTLMAQIEDW
jgi:hypothetical protein